MSNWYNTILYQEIFVKQISTLSLRSAYQSLPVGAIMYVVCFIWSAQGECNMKLWHWTQDGASHEWIGTHLVSQVVGTGSKPFLTLSRQCRRVELCVNVFVSERDWHSYIVHRMVKYRAMWIPSYDKYIEFKINVSVDSKIYRYGPTRDKSQSEVIYYCLLLHYF